MRRLFSVEVEDRERLVIVQEIEPRQRDLDSDDALAAIRRAIAAQHELEVHAIVLAKAGAIPKTSSGKTQRSACRERYLGGQLEVIAQWKADVETLGDEPREAPPTAPARSVPAAEIEGWLIEWIAARLKAPPSQVPISTPFVEFGMSSVDAVEMATELEQRLGRRLSPTAVYNYPNIAALARWLASPPADGTPPLQVFQASDPLGSTQPDQMLDDIRNMREEDIKHLSCTR